ncbi:MAG: hypothetical protein IPN90_09390 [Elusimicrobia bacterium]|nr:hypothetical protein [Elusimicrobiota bacterium]
MRKNSHKWNKSPLDILREAAPSAAEAIVTLPVLDLDDLVRRRVRHLIQSPSPPGDTMYQDAPPGIDRLLPLYDKLK